MKPFKAGILVLAAIAFSTAVGNASNGPTTKPPTMEQKAPVAEWAMPTVATEYVAVKAVDVYCPEVPAEEMPNHTVKFYLDLCARLTQVNDKIDFTPQWCYRQFIRPPSVTLPGSKTAFNSYKQIFYSKRLLC